MPVQAADQKFTCAYRRRHDSPANIAKMHSGIPLDDDRLPWLQAIAKEIDRWRAERRYGVIACSALKRRYRDIIIGERLDVQLVYLCGDRSLIAKRLAARQGHFHAEAVAREPVRNPRRAGAGRAGHHHLGRKAPIDARR
jgi:carbohydrate kinase (thermoresistant glucokinase family)